MENNFHIRFHVLFLTKWYPNYKDNQIAVFVKKHAKAVAKFCNVSLLYVSSNDEIKEKYKTEILEKDFFEVIIYYRKSSLKIVNFLRKIAAYRKGLKLVSRKNGRPDLLHLNILVKHGLLTLLLKKLKDIPYIVTEHWTGYSSGKFYSQNFISKYLQKKTASNAEAITVVSHSLKKSLEEAGIKNHLFVIPNVVDIPEKISLTKNDKKIILTVADLADENKNISGTIRAIETVSRIKKNFEFHIIGGGDDEANLKQQTAASGLLDKIIFFHGRQTNDYVYDYLKKADFLVVNSNVETFSVVAAEAMASGKPIIATICGGPEEFVNEESGILIKKGNQKELEMAILYMLDFHHTYHPERLREIIKEKFNADKIAEQFYEIYKLGAIKFTIGLSGEKAIIHPEWKVLDVGSGHRPNKRANVLLDNELNETEHRSGKKAHVPSNQQMIVGDALKMPFADKEFDYAIASHIAEHVDNPEKFCAELSRVAKAGYIETPGWLDELFLNEPFHKWVVKKKGNSLVFRAKKNFKPFSDFIYGLYYLNEDRFGHKTIKSKSAGIKLLQRMLHNLWKILPGTYVRHHWQDEIKARVLK